MIVEAPDVAATADRGSHHASRRRVRRAHSLTIADVDREQGTITLYYQIVGKTTEQMSCLKRAGTLKTLPGRWGTDREIRNYGTAVCVGGGIGVAPIYPIAAALARRETG
jgi:ferredoxin--NADP+ reductase